MSLIDEISERPIVLEVTNAYIPGPQGPPGTGGGSGGAGAGLDLDISNYTPGGAALSQGNFEASLDAAFAYAKTLVTGSTIYIPRGIWLCTKSIALRTLPAPSFEWCISLKGAGSRNTKLVFPSTLNKGAIEIQTNALGYDNVQRNITTPMVTGLQIDGTNRAGNTIGMTLQSCIYGSFEDLWFTNCAVGYAMQDTPTLPGQQVNQNNTFRKVWTQVNAIGSQFALSNTTGFYDCGWDQDTVRSFTVNGMEASFYRCIVQGNFSTFPAVEVQPSGAVLSFKGIYREGTGTFIKVPDITPSIPVFGTRIRVEDMYVLVVSGDVFDLGSIQTSFTGENWGGICPSPGNGSLVKARHVRQLTLRNVSATPDTLPDARPDLFDLDSYSRLNMSLTDGNYTFNGNRSLSSDLVSTLAPYCLDIWDPGNLRSMVITAGAVSSIKGLINGNVAGPNFGYVAPTFVPSSANFSDQNAIWFANTHGAGGSNMFCTVTNPIAANSPVGLFVVMRTRTLLVGGGDSFGGPSITDAVSTDTFIAFESPGCYVKYTVPTNTFVADGEHVNPGVTPHIFASNILSLGATASDWIPGQQYAYTLFDNDQFDTAGNFSTLSPNAQSLFRMHPNNAGAFSFEVAFVAVLNKAIPFGIMKQATSLARARFGVY